MKQKLLSLLCAILTALTVLTGAIAVPILCRPFYYAHVNAYHLTEYGWSQDEIYTAYNEMMDYCTGRREDFSAGVLAFSESGASHFADVRGLFPCGEGAGYAGGITSAAMDGIKVAEEIARRLGPGREGE